MYSHCDGRDNDQPKDTRYSADSWSPNPWLYSFGRPFPRRLLLQLSIPLLDRFQSNEFAWYEPGAGTGRIVIPIGIQFPTQKIYASEITRDMFQVLEAGCTAENTSNIIRIHEDARTFTPRDRVNLFLISSLFHLIPNWQQLLRHLCEIAADSSAFLLLGERGDIYELLLGERITNYDVRLSEICTEYITLREKYGIPVSRRAVAGTQWSERNEELVAELVSTGFSEVESRSVDWQQFFSYSDIFRIISERLYSSMFTAPSELYAKVVAELAERVASNKSEDRIQSSHSATARLLCRG